jgi:hypothetical protein
MNLPHPAIICSGPQLLKVIEELEAGTYPQPGDAIWRDDLPRDLAIRLALATGATPGALKGSNPPMSTTRYMIVRFYASAGIRRRIIARGLTQAEAKAHCEDPETSSSTAQSAAAQRRTHRVGPWFDGWTEDRSRY